MTALPPAREGYWYDATDPRTELVREGARVRRAASGPPWIVVDQHIASITIGSHWPGRLWRVRVTVLGDMSGLVAEPGYWRASEIELIDALPLSALFGPHGDAVLDVLARIESLSVAQATALSNANALAPDAEAAYGRAWAHWSEGTPASAATPAQDWAGTLAASSRGGAARSPVHGGFLLIHGQLWKRAQAIGGADAILRTEDEDGEIEESLAAPWDGACSALLHAAMARGAPGLVPAADSTTLTRAFDTVFGG
ncbi:hypothetical protein [Bordetella genomosp. 5]|uniref:Uncharacterized protein n=1 Tax=Bordetella genomosp. 5 TaxID=1395608 RepID=A0A261TJ53_9BORD|nr:hypothetical protein [Bordetella genomosp. 5]OZI49060.1 hypothetical protein CAL25_15675 [Bordetella genomosp. 5]